MNNYEVSQEIEKRRLSNEKKRLRRIEYLEEKIPDYALLRSKRNELLAEAAIFRITNRKDEAIKKEREAEQLTKKEYQLLEKLGLDKNFLEVQYTCSKCKDVGFLEDGSICDCLSHLIHLENFNRYDLNQQTKEDNFENFRLDIYSDQFIEGLGKSSPRTFAQINFNKARLFCYNFDNQSISLFITGKPGTGKTFLVSCIVNELLKNDRDIIYISSPNLINLLYDDVKSNNASFNSNKYKFKNADLLIIDDLGTEIDNNFTRNSISEIIDERLVLKKPTIITTNYINLKDRYPARMVSRVDGFFETLQFMGDDLRKRTANR